MDLGAVVKEIKPRSKILVILIELLIGGGAVIGFFIPVIRTGFYEKYAVLGFPSEYIFLILGIIVIVMAMYTMVTTNPIGKITVFEKGLSVGDFSATFENLKIRTKKNYVVFSDTNRSITYKDRLTRADYNYIKNLL